MNPLSTREKNALKRVVKCIWNIETWCTLDRTVITTNRLLASFAYWEVSALAENKITLLRRELSCYVCARSNVRGRRCNIRINIHSQIDAFRLQPSKCGWYANAVTHLVQCVGQQVEFAFWCSHIVLLIATHTHTHVHVYEPIPVAARSQT